MTLITSWTIWDGPKIIIEKNLKKKKKKKNDLEEKSSDNCLISLYNMSANVTHWLNFTIDMLVAFHLYT